MPPSVRTLTFLTFGGFGVSALLTLLEGLHHSSAWMSLQLPGFLLGESIWGLVSSGWSFEIAMVIINGIVYSAFLFAVWIMRRALKASR